MCTCGCVYVCVCVLFLVLLLTLFSLPTFCSPFLFSAPLSIFSRLLFFFPSYRAHSMRDNPYHNVPMLGGMWGGVHNFVAPHNMTGTVGVRVRELWVWMWECVCRSVSVSVSVSVCTCACSSYGVCIGMYNVFALTSCTDLIDKWGAQHNKGEDQTFLASEIWPKVKHDTFG